MSFESRRRSSTTRLVTHPAWARLNNGDGAAVLFAFSVVLSHAGRSSIPTVSGCFESS